VNIKKIAESSNRVKCFQSQTPKSQDRKSWFGKEWKRDRQKSMERVDLQRDGSGWASCAL